MHANQIIPTTNVYRSRFFSATEEPARLDETPPPNMLDRPPPLPRCSRISSVSSTLVMMSSTTRVYANAVMAVVILSATVFRPAKSSGPGGLDLRPSQGGQVRASQHRGDVPAEHLSAAQPDHPPLLHRAI